MRRTWSRVTSTLCAGSSGAASTQRPGSASRMDERSRAVSSLSMWRATSATWLLPRPSLTNSAASPNCRFRSISATRRRPSCVSRCARLAAMKVVPQPPLQDTSASTCPAGPGSGVAQPRRFRIWRLWAAMTAATTAAGAQGAWSTSRTPARRARIRISGSSVGLTSTTSTSGCAPHRRSIVSMSWGLVVCTSTRSGRLPLMAMLASFSADTTSLTSKPPWLRKASPQARALAWSGVTILTFIGIPRCPCCS